MTLVVDATVTITSIGSAEGFKALGDDDLVAPVLMWSEARSTIHLGLLNGKVSAEHANLQHERLESCPVRRVDDPEIGWTAWRLAEQLGWGRTYDAEYVALAQILGCRLVTLDGPLRRGADRLGFCRVAGRALSRWGARGPRVRLGRDRKGEIAARSPGP